MKTKKEFNGTWYEFRVSLEDQLPESTIENNISFFRECYDYFMTPDRAVRFLIE